jgi:pyruvate,orthophosphate dikinase
MRRVYDLEEAFPGRSREEVRRLIGAKAANLGVMAVELGLPVPPAFTVSAPTCLEVLRDGWPAGLDDELREHLTRMETRVGRRFGDPADPLLVSVRSGAAVSMPGMLDTILDLGLTTATAAGLATATGSEEFANDCRRRFYAMFRRTVGVEEVPEDPWRQLRLAIEAVFRSWETERARAYRARESIPDDLGTAVTVQAMVFGNRGPGSGTGVLFTRDPATGEGEAYGDFLFGAQGEDVVAGTHRTQPIGVLDERLPDVARELRDASARLERHLGDLCDIEFTIEDGRLWLLQCRVGKRSPAAALRMAVDMARDPGFPLTREAAVRRVASLLRDPPRRALPEVVATAPPLTRGLAASPGRAAGAVALSSAVAIGRAEAGERVVLVRAETSPDDVPGMARSVAILTATGGLVSHAAVVARGWGLPAVVGAAGVVPRVGHVRIGARTFAEGEMITVDGTTGDVFAGAVAGASEVVPEAAILLGWARELGIAIDDEGGPARGPGAGEPSPAPGQAVTSAVSGPTTDDLLRLLLIKGYALPAAVEEALGGAPDELEAGLGALVAAGLAEAASGSFRLTPAGRDAAGALIAADRATWGLDADAALDAFLPLDRRTKAIVTAWQMRDVDGTQTFNDHADAAYDAAVLADLGALHAEAGAWLRSLAGGLPRLARYAERLDRANAAAQAGDGRFVASPRVDSYHGCWFELHEDLIQLAGRSRADEVAAGRA